MAWQRDEANLGISGATAYSYTEVDWEVHGDRCTYRHIGGVTSPYNFSATATSTLQWWESGTWHDYAGPASATFNGYGDLPLVDVEDYFVRQAADRVVSLGTYTTMMGGSARSYIDYTVPHAAPAVTWAASNPVVRNSDNSITLTWNAPALEYSAMCLEVSTDGGSWSQFAVLWNTATSYEWTGCSADHSYQFRIRTNYLASYSAYDTCATVIYMTPAAPQSISTAAAGGTNITVNLVNPSTVATKVQYEVSTDDGATWGATQDSASLTSFTVSASGTVKIRVRNYNATGTSAWLTSDTVTTICPPAKPTITSPQTGAWDVSQPLDVSWLHNSLDGSAQEAYKLRVTKLTPPLDSHTETYSPSTASTQSLTWAQIQSWLPTLALGGKLGIGIATKGADASYSDYGATAGITPFTAPTLSITSPSATVTGMPIQIAATYSDMAGFTCQAATVTLKSGDRTILTKPATISGTSLSCDISPSDAILENGATYTIVLDVRSSSGLQASANATFTTAFVPPKAGDLQISNDPATGYVSLLAQVADDEQAQGESVRFKWNQLGKSNVTYAVNGLTLTKVDDATARVTGTASATAGIVVSASTLFPRGHMFYLFPNCTLEGAKFGITGYGANYTGEHVGIVRPASSGSDWGGSMQISYFSGVTYDYTAKPCIIDLTAIFGAGNEPTTVEAFKATPEYQAMQAQGKLYAYDAGSMQSYQMPLDTSEGDYLHSVEIQGSAERFAPTFTDYSGSTNTQYDSAAGSVGRLTVEGKSAKWNNQIIHGYFPDSSAYWQSHNKCSASVANNTITLTVTTAGGATTNYLLVQNFAVSGSILGSHKYYIGFDVNASKVTTIANYMQADSGTNRRTNFDITEANTWLHKRTIKEFPDATQTFKQFQMVNYATTEVGDTFMFRNLVIVDLTAIYGAGNEPSTAADFEASGLYRTKFVNNGTDADAGSLVSIGSVDLIGRNLLQKCNGETTGSYPFGYNYNTNPLKLPYVLANGTTVTFSFESKNTQAAQLGIILVRPDGTSYSVYTYTNTTGRKSNSFTLNGDVSSVGFYSSNSALVSADYQLEVGGSATAYSVEPQGAFGHNLVDISATPYATNVVSYTQANGTLDITATAASGWAYVGLSVPCSAAGDYTVSFDVETAGTFMVSIEIWAGGTRQKYKTTTAAHFTTITADSSTTELRILLYCRSTSSGAVGDNAKYSNLMLAKSSSPEPFTPYNANYAPLRSAGSVHDTLMADEDSYTVRRNVGAVDLGSLTWTVEAAWQSSKSLTRYYAPLTGAPTTASENVIIPDFTANSQVVLSTMSAAYCCALYNGRLYITMPYPTFTNQSDITTWLTSNPHTAFYELATPTQDAETSMSTLTIGTAFTINTDLGSTFTMKATADLFAPYVLTTTGTGTVSGGTISHQAISLTTKDETYADVLSGEWLAGIGDVKDTASIGATTTIERRIGCVDLGSLTWVANSLVSTIYYATVPNMYVPTDALERLEGIMCAQYPIDTRASIDASMTDKTMKRSSGVINIRDDDYLTAAAFKTAMDGVLLYYELATPTTVTVTGTDYEELNVPDWLTLNAYQDSPVTALYGNGIEDVQSISVARVNADGSITPLLEDGSAGAGIVDKYAPLNTPYQYAVTTMSAAHAVNTVFVDNEIITDLWFAYWGDNIASAKWNPDNGGIQIARPQKIRVFYAGRKDPVSYDGAAVALSETPSWMLVDRSEVQPFVQLIEDGGRGVYKSCDGWVYHADFDLTLSPKYIAIGYYGGIGLTVTRIAGDAL